MSPKAKKILITLLVIIIAASILKITSNLSNIQIGLAVFFGWLIFKVANQKKLIKYPGASIGIIGLVFMLGLAYLPLFENTPNPQDFINTQSRHIVVNSPEDTSIISTKQQSFVKQQEIFEANKEIMLKESPISIINFTNKNKQSTANMTIQFADQTTVYIYPNTSFSLEISGNKQIINKLSGKIEYLTGQSNNITINNAILQNISDFSAKGLWNKYKEKQREYIVEKAGGILMENQTIRNMSHTMLILASKIRPNPYLSYLENEKTYKILLNRQDSTPQTFENNTQETASDILNQAKQAGSKTKFLQFLNK